MRQHHCNGKWVEGTVASCSKHGPTVRNAPEVKLGRVARAKKDREAGVVGRDDGLGSYRGT